MYQKSTQFVEWVLIGLSSLSISIYCYVAYSRLVYPFTIEWCEGNTFINIVQLLEGKQIFVPPSFDFIPSIYMPFYYYVTALLAKLTGQIMFSMRLISILASLLAFVSIYFLCRGRKISPRISIVATGLFAACYGVTGYWFDVGRIDMLYIGLLLFAYMLCVIRTKHEKLVGFFAGFVLFLSYATKQTALAAFPFILIYLILNHRWMNALWLGISFSASGILFVTIMNIVSKGWFWFYTYLIPSSHPVSIKMITQNFWTQYISPKFLWIIGIIALSALLLILVNDKNAFFDKALFDFSFLLPLCIMSVSTMAKQWGYINGLLPIVAAFAVVGAEAFQRITILLNLYSNHIKWRKVIYYLVSIAILFQFFALRYDFRSQIPNSATLKAGNKILKMISSSEAPMFIPTASYLLYLAGKPIHYHTAAMGDVELASAYNPKIDEITKGYKSEIDEYLLSGLIKTAILPDEIWVNSVFNKKNGYKCKSLLDGKPPLITFTGAFSWLEYVCRKVE